MRRFTSARPSPAMVVAFIALLAALSGTATALQGKNTVDSGDIKNGVVKSDDIKNGGVGSKDVKNGGVTTDDLKNNDVGSGDVRDNTLTGTDINEGTLGQVPSANAANSANTANSANSANTANSANSAGSVDGLSFARINYQGTEGSGGATVLSVGGLIVTASCAPGLDLELEATTTIDNAAINSSNVSDSTSFDDSGDTNDTKSVTTAEDEDFDAGDAVNLLPDSPNSNERDDEMNSYLVYTTPGGTIITAQFRSEEDTNGLASANDCFVIGHAAIS